MNKRHLCMAVIGLGLWACDTAENIRPRNDNFFVKMYDGVRPGNQQGVDIIATADGGLLIAATGDSLGTKEMLLIKTDSRGNEEWTYSAANDLGTGVGTEAKSIVGLADGYLVGCTLNNNQVSRSVLLKISFDGLFLDSALITTDTLAGVFNNTLAKVTLGASGILVSGQTDRPIIDINGNTIGGINGYVALYDPVSLEPDPTLQNSITYFGLEGNDYVVGGYEVNDVVNSIGKDSTRYLIFGHSDLGTGGAARKNYYVGFKRDMSSTNEFVHEDVNETEDQVAHHVTRFGDTFVVIGEIAQSGQQIFMVEWKFRANAVTGTSDWQSLLNGVVPTADNTAGIGVALQNENSYIIVGTMEFSEIHSEIYLAGVNANFRVESPWPQTFGTNTSTYTAGAVTVLADGSIVVVGTADLEGNSKVVVIKTGPNGEMTF